MSYPPATRGLPIPLSGATVATRYVGGNASGAPLSGTFAVGDFVVNADASLFVCTVAGSPGTWVDAATVGPSVASVFTRTGTVVAVDGDYYGVVAAAKTGATAASRYVGATASGAPASGTFAIGDFIIDQTGKVFICTVAGTPGTWVQAGAGAVASVFSRTGAVVAASNDYTFAQISTANGAIALAKLADPTAGKVVGSSGGLAAAVSPPGTIISQTAITSSVAITSTTEATGTTVISPGSVTFDGTLVRVEFFASSASAPLVVGSNLVVSLFESTTQITRLCRIDGNSVAANSTQPLIGIFYFTPSAGAHTYTVTAFVGNNTGGPEVSAGAGGTAALSPAYLLFTKA